MTAMDDKQTGLYDTFTLIAQRLYVLANFAHYQ